MGLKELIGHISSLDVDCIETELQSIGDEQVMLLLLKRLVVEYAEHLANESNDDGKTVAK